LQTSEHGRDARATDSHASSIPTSTVPPSQFEPYLSIVATARNDNHGGALLQRMQAFIDSVIEQCRRFQLPAELILVDWNPPADKPPLRDALRWPGKQSDASPHCQVRVIEVNSELHGRFRHAEALPLFQFIAKNAGIRRAAGRWILATNIDVLFTDELMQRTAAQSLEAHRMYRVDRWDVRHDIPLDATQREQLAWCGANVIRINRRTETLDCRSGQVFRIYWEPTWKVQLLEWLQDAKLVPVVTRKRLHLNACGDFTLLHRDRWAELRGYPELEMFSMYIDGLLCTAAHFHGVAETMLDDPCRVYHIEHGIGSGWSPEGQDAMNKRIAAAGIRQLTHDEFHKWSIEMRKNEAPMQWNDDAWGLRDVSLDEWRVA
jgi:hypothetical protein